MITDNATPIYTIGHANRTPTELLNALAHRHIAFLIDVRTPAEQAIDDEFSPSALVDLLQTAAIRYVPLTHAYAEAPLGANGVLHYPTVRATAGYQQAVNRLQSAFQQQQRVALLGVAAAPDACQRSQLFGASLHAQGIPVIHIDPEGDGQSQEDVMWALANEALAWADFAEDAPYDEPERATTPAAIAT